MNTRRDALKLMAAGLGSCVLPSIGLSQTTTRRSHYIMGVDQLGGRCYYIIKKLTTGIQINGHCDFELLPHLMGSYNIDQCVIDSQPNIVEVKSFARQFSGRVILGCWTNQTIVDDFHGAVPAKIYVPGKLFLHRGSHGTCDMAFAVKKAWVHPRENHGDSDAMLCLRIAQFIQTTAT